MHRDQLKETKMDFTGNITPPALNEKYFFDHLSRVVDYYSRKFDRFVIMGDFNSEPSDEQVESFCTSYNLHNLVKAETCFKGLLC